MRQFFLISVLGLVLGSFGILFDFPAIISLLSLGLYVLGLSYVAESRLPFDLKGLGVPLILAILVLPGSLLYYLLPVSYFSLLLTALFPYLLLFLPAARVIRPSPPHIRPLFLLSVLLFLGGALLLSSYQFTDPVRSPWDIAPLSIFLIFFVLISLSTLLPFLKNSQEISWVQLLPLSLFPLSITPLLYKLGYGFDPFVHRATLSHILEHGSISPKPLYYTGQYVLELVFVKLFNLPLFGVDVWLVPVLGSILLSILFSRLARHFRYAPFVLLFTPFASFIFTTPQSLSYLFFGMTVLSIYLLFTFDSHRLHYAIPWVLALSTALIHPISGVPALLLCLLFTISFIPGHALRNSLYALAGTLGVLGLPSLFVLQSFQQGISSPIRFSGISSSSSSILDLSNHYSGYLDLLYFLPRVLIPFITALICYGIYTLYRQQPKITVIFSIALTVLTLNFSVLTFFIDFSFLASSEQLNYANRIPLLLFLVATPFLAISMQTVLDFVVRNKNTYIIPLLFITLLGVGNAYQTFPRNDGTVRARGINVSHYDIEGVQSIYHNYELGNYTVLSNQTFSASALEQYGFAHYFDHDVFYYPIPTGGPLYELFLAVSEEEVSRNSIHDAHELTGARTILFVSHDYWSRSEQAREEAKQSADRWYSIGANEEILIFEFDFSSPQ